jgi:Fe-S cluster assembly iron-binding protein IscA
MLQVTPQARDELHGMLERALAERPQSEPAPTLGFRLVAGPSAEGEGSKLGLALDAPRGGDQIVEHGGRSLLLVDAAAAPLVENLTLDVVETPEGTRLSLRK